jgi:hypothetical protein
MENEMTKSIDPTANDPLNESERRLFDLLREGIDGGVSQETSIAELSAELRARISNKR